MRGTYHTDTYGEIFLMNITILIFTGKEEKLVQLDR